MKKKLRRSGGRAQELGTTMRESYGGRNSLTCFRTEKGRGEKNKCGENAPFPGYALGHADPLGKEGRTKKKVSEDRRGGSLSKSNDRSKHPRAPNRTYTVHAERGRKNSEKEWVSVLHRGIRQREVLTRVSEA